MVSNSSGTTEGQGTWGDMQVNARRNKEPNYKYPRSYGVSMAQHKAMKETIIEAETRRGEDFKIRLGIERETFKGRMYSDGPITVNFYSVEVERHDDYSNVWLWTKGGDIATKVAVDNHVGQRITAAAGRHGMVR